MLYKDKTTLLNFNSCINGPVIKIHYAMSSIHPENSHSKVKLLFYTIWGIQFFQKRKKITEKDHWVLNTLEQIVQPLL